MEIRADSTEYVTATITSNADLTANTIEVALPETGVDPVTFLLAEVVSSVSQGTGKYLTTYRLLLGPGGAKTLAKGTTYDWIVRITDTPEVPVRAAGTVTAT